jgi:uncharacterized protein with NAD-binding domain and iron-sulfur cluster
LILERLTTMSTTPTSLTQVPEKIAILGGGIAALTTAFELTRLPDWAQKYDITLYQMGWRLGGKCATGRGPNSRIEEHGIHGFLGSYYNALPLMVDLYAALGRQPGEPLATFDEAFHPENFVLMWEFRDNSWKQWPFTAPQNALRPDQGDSLPTLTHWLQAIIRLVNDMFDKNQAAFLPGGGDHFHIGRTLLEKAEQALVHALEHEAGVLLGMLDAAWLWFRNHTESLIDGNDTLRHIYIAADYMLALVRGTIADDILHRGFDVIDDENFSDWLIRHGASVMTVSSPLALNTVNLSYQYPQGDTTRTALMGAGCYLNWTLRSFAYLGSFAWLFEAGTGETIIAPLYQVLAKRGVKFQFFHKVEALRLSADGQSVAAVDMGVQATLKDKSVHATYAPLIDVKGLPAWPGQPLYAQLDQGEALQTQAIDLESYWTPWQPVAKTSLQAGRDFDRLVFAISLGAVPHLCPELLAARPAWRDMCDKVTTVQTQTMQLWFNRSTADLGRDTAFKNPHDTVIGATYLNPLDGNVDFSHLLKWEDWERKNTSNPADAPKALWYFSGAMDDCTPPPPFTDTGYPQRQYERVKYQCIQYLQASIGPLLPKATTDVVNPPGDPIGLDFSLLSQTTDRQPPAIGIQRFDQQFWRANIDPTERYVTSPPGSTRYRLKAWGSGFTNLVLAGDWIYTGLNVGSVEGTVMSGRLAAHAISGLPALADITGYPLA